jgi:hypothetical protein
MSNTITAAVRDSCLRQNVQTGSGAQPVGTEILSRVKRPGRDVDHSPPSNAEVKNEWSSTSTAPTCLHGVDRDKLTFFTAVCTPGL